MLLHYHPVNTFSLSNLNLLSCYHQNHYPSGDLVDPQHLPQLGPAASSWTPLLTFTTVQKFPESWSLGGSHSSGFFILLRSIRWVGYAKLFRMVHARLLSVVVFRLRSGCILAVYMSGQDNCLSCWCSFSITDCHSSGDIYMWWINDFWVDLDMKRAGMKITQEVTGT